MTHLSSEEYLNEANIDQYFQALAEKIRLAGIGEHTILVVGGAAMALKYRDGRSTVDIDICLREQNHLYKCCRTVAEEFGLPDDWINADVMHSDSFSYGLFQNAVFYKEYASILKVYTANSLDLYCMKLVSFRPKDVQDLQVLAEELRGRKITAEAVKENFTRLYGDSFLLENDPRKMRLVRSQLVSV